MAKTDTKKAPSARENLLSRVRERYPDRTFADLDATEPQEGVYDLYEAINEMLEEYITKQATYDENNNKLRDLVMSDPSAAEFLQRWLETGDPRTALIAQFGEELGISEEKQAEFKSQLDGWRERKAANDALAAEAEANWNKSLEELQAWGEAKGLTMEQMRDVMLRLLAITFNGMENKYGPDDFDLAYKAINHDADVAVAREEGEVAGRNQKIAATRRDRAAAGNVMPPASVGRQGGAVAPPRPKKKSFWAEVNEG